MIILKCYYIEILVHWEDYANGEGFRFNLIQKYVSILMHLCHHGLIFIWGSFLIPTQKNSSIFIHENSIAIAWREALAKIYQSQNVVVDQRGDKMMTFYNLGVTVDHPLDRLDLLEKLNKDKLSYYNLQYLDQYADQLLNGPKPSENPHEYNYHDRLTKRWSRLSKNWYVSQIDTEITETTYLNQINQIIKLLKKNPNTRRAVAVTWIPSVDLFKEDVPCMDWLVFMPLLDDVLGLSAGFRSHDFYGAVVPNWYGLARLLQSVAKAAGKRMGPVTTFSANAHFNMNVEDIVMEILRW